MENKNINFWERALKNPPKAYFNLFEKEKSYLRKHIKKDENVLDVGCGEGRNILSIVDITNNIIGIDNDQKAVDDTKENLKEYSSVSIILGNATTLPFNNQVFDVVIMSMTLVNLDNEKTKALSEMKRVLKHCGKIIISVYSEKSLNERWNMYKQVDVPIKKVEEGKFIFDTDNFFVSEQFSFQNIEEISKSIGLRIDSYEEVENLAYIFTLKKARE